MTDYDYDVNSGVGGDNRSPRAAGRLEPSWSKDGSHLLDVVAKQGRAILVDIDATSGKVTEVSRGDQAVEQLPVIVLVQPAQCFFPLPRRATEG